MLIKELIFIYRSWKFLTFSDGVSGSNGVDWLIGFCSLYRNYTVPSATMEKIHGNYVTSNFKTLTDLHNRIKDFTVELRTNGVIDSHVNISHNVIKATEWVGLGELSAKECSESIEQVVNSYVMLIREVKKADDTLESGNRHYQGCNYRAILPLVGEAREILNITLSLGEIKHARTIKAKARGNTKG